MTTTPTNFKLSPTGGGQSQPAQDTGPSATDNYTASYEPVVVGNADPTSTINIFDGATLIGTGTTNAGGTFSIQTNKVLSDGLHTLSATATLAGNTSAAASFNVTIDNTAPVLTPHLATDSGPSQTDTITNNATLTGSGDPNAVVTLNQLAFDNEVMNQVSTRSADSGWSAQITASASTTVTGFSVLTTQTDVGNLKFFVYDETASAFAYTSAPVTFGADKITAGQSDFNVTFKQSPNFNLTLTPGHTYDFGAIGNSFSYAWFYASNGPGDHHVPTAITEGNLTQIVGNANFTNFNTPAIGTHGTGTQFPVEIYFSSNTTNADATGSWTYTPAGLNNGTYTFLAVEHDLAGNTNSVTPNPNPDPNQNPSFWSGEPTTFTLDTTAPTVAITSQTLANDTGVSNSDLITNDGHVTLNGTVSDTGGSGLSSVHIFNGTTDLGAATVSGGTWTFSTNLAPDGQYSLHAQATDTAGNTAVTTNEPTITIDSTAPTVSSIVKTGSSPTNATTVNYTVTFSEAVTGVDATDFALAATGSIAGSTITNVSGSGTTYTITANDGSGDGTLQLNFVDNDSVIDTAGNPVGGSGAGNGNFTGPVYTIDKTAPAQPSIALVTDHGSHFDVFGGAEANSTVAVTDTNGAVPSFSTTADGTSHYDAVSTAALVDGSHGLSVTATDAAGNTSTASLTDHIVVQTVSGVHIAFSDTNFTIADDSALTGLIMDGTGLTGTGNSHGNDIHSVESHTTDVNTLIGGSGADLLVGGIGADNLQGGGGNDTYVVHNSATTINDSGGANDVVYAEGVDYNLAARAQPGIEALILENGSGLTGTGYAGTANILYSLDAAGQSNTLIGGSASDLLVGGLGSDHLQGGGGNDTFVVHSSATTVSDSGGSNNVVYAEGVNFALTDGDGINALIIEGSGHTATGHPTTTTTIYSTGTGNTLVGGSATDLLVAGAHGDTLIGNGGNDHLVGGAGNDTFQFGTGFGQDKVYNFHPHDGGSNQDTIKLTGEAPGTTFASMLANHQIFDAVDPSQTSGFDVIVEHDPNDYAVILNQHVANLSASDFLIT